MAINPEIIVVKKLFNKMFSNHLENKNIVIEENMSQVMHIKTGIHEITHALLHDKDNGIEKDLKSDIETKEVQAESVAFTVCQYYGIDSSDYSFGYISGWSSGKDLKELKTSMEVIRKTAQTVISGINEKLEGVKLSRQKGMEISKSINFPKQEKDLHKRSMKH